MFKIKMNYPNKYFENYYYERENNTARYFIFPIKEFEHYQKNIISFETYGSYFNDIVFKTKLTDIPNFKKSIAERFGDGILTFEFETEEEAFYFKLKYC